MRILILSWLFSMVGVQALADTSHNSSKITLRSGFGAYENAGTLSGSSAGPGGFNVQYNQYLTSTFAMGVGYVAQFDINQGSTPIRGFEVFAKKYFWGNGTKETIKSEWGSITLKSPYGIYASGLYGLRSFYLGEDTESTDPTKKLAGDYSIINAGVGCDYRMKDDFELNVELTMSLMPLSSTDSRVKISEKVLWMGMGYTFW